ncbi:hypothetical protein FDECE_5035 [Fusarium decemcellulare]|nr:hypothetical protein FDECE_5035 [Fusarium decemcellulare]
MGDNAIKPVTSTMVDLSFEKDPTKQQDVLGIESNAETRLQRGLKSRHISMIAIGGAIGTGLIIGTGKALAQAGPGSLLISYTIVGFIVFFLMTAVGEMASWLPMSAGFAGYASRFCDPSLGFTIGWIYWLKYLLATPNQLTAAALVIQFWVPRDQLNPGVFIAVFLVLVICINFFGVRFFGEFEFWLSSFKVITILGLIVFSLVLALGGGPDHDRRGFRYWQDPGAFREYIDTGSLGRFLGFWSTMINAVFAFFGTELIGVTVAEAENPRKTIPRATKLTFYRILLFYVLSVLVVGMVVPYNSEMLAFANQSKTSASASPFVVAARLAGVKAAAHIINACILLFVFSAGNTDLYIASRTLYGLSSNGLAPNIFKRTNHQGTPVYALSLSAAFTLLAFMNVSDDSKQIFSYFVNVATILGLLTWISILITHIWWCRARQAQRLHDECLPYVAPLGIWGSYGALFVCVLVALTKNFDVFVNLDDEPFGKEKFKNFITGYIGIPVFVDAWLGIDYAVQPTGDRRFRPVEAQPASFSGTKNATQYGKVCVQSPKSVPYEQDEACLNFNVYRTAGIPLEQKLPTMVWIHGGGFVAESARSMDGASFVASSKTPIAVVTFNYRLNSLGFLPSRLFQEEGLLNLGLRDQKFFLRFLQTHLASFGGDADQITLGGRSAGAHATGIHYFHNYNEDENKALFARAIFQSGAVTARAFPAADYPQYQRDFAILMDHIKCPTDVSNAAQLDCLRAAPVHDIEQITSKLYAESEGKLSWSWQPTLGGPLLERAGSKSGVEGTFHRLPAITSYATDEGKFYTPGWLETNDDFIRTMHQVSPYLNHTDLAILNELYPDPVANIDSPWAGSPNSTQYNRVSAAWSDMAYLCPSRESARRISAANVPIYKLRFNTPDYPLEAQSWRGIPHTSDFAYGFNDPGVAYPETAYNYHAYLASFVATGDPNKLRREETPEWPVYDGSRKDTPYPEQLVVNPGNFVAIEQDISRLRQCDFWNDVDRADRLNK